MGIPYLPETTKVFLINYLLLLIMIVIMIIIILISLDNSIVPSLLFITCSRCILSFFTEYLFAVSQKLSRAFRIRKIDFKFYHYGRDSCISLCK